jgi:hypothetical protein
LALVGKAGTGIWAILKMPYRATVAVGWVGELVVQLESFAYHFTVGIFWPAFWMLPGAIQTDVVQQKPNPP